MFGESQIKEADYMTENMKIAVNKQAKKLQGTFGGNSFEKSDIFENISGKEVKNKDNLKDLKYSERLSFTNNDSFNNSLNESQNIQNLNNRVSDCGPKRALEVKNQLSPSKSQAAKKTKQQVGFQRYW